MTSSNSTARRLIEEWLPINELSVEAVRERAGAVPNPAPHQLHVWWARRPLIASQAAVAASLLNDGVEHNAFTAAMGTYSDVYEDSQKIAVANAAGTRSAKGITLRQSNGSPTHGHGAFQYASKVCSWGPH